MKTELTKQILTAIVSFGSAAIGVINGCKAISNIRELTSADKGETK